MAKGTSKVNYGQRFTTNKTSKQKDLKFKGKVSYISREQALQKHDSLFVNDKHVYESNGYLTREESIKKHQHIFQNYQNDNRVVYFTNNGAVRQNDEEELRKNERLLDEIQSKYINACLYESFTSFNYEFAEKNIDNKYTEVELHEEIKPHIKKLFKDNNLDFENTKYFLTFHSNKDHFHFHLDFIETVPTREKNELDLKSFENYRKNLMLSLDEELQEEYRLRSQKIQEQKNEVRQSINQIDLNEELVELLNKASEVYKEEAVRYYGDLPEDSPLKEIILNIKREVIQSDKELENNLELFDELLEEQNEFNQKLFGEYCSRNQKDNQLSEVDKRLDNKIFKIIKINSKSNQEYSHVQLDQREQISSRTTTTKSQNNNKYDEDLNLYQKYKLDRYTDDKKYLPKSQSYNSYKFKKLTNDLKYVAKKKQHERQQELRKFDGLI